MYFIRLNDISFLRKIINRNKVVFINETNLKPKHKTVFGKCPARGVLYVFTDIDNFENRSEGILQVTLLKISTFKRWEIVVFQVKFN